MRTNALLLALTLLVACEPKTISLGDETSAGSSETETASASGEAGEETTDGFPPMAGLGAPCDHDRAPGDVPDSRLLTFPTTDCPGAVCLYSDIAEAPADPCDDAADCNSADPGSARFECDAGTDQCELSGDYVASRSFCSGFCESDADCLSDGETDCQTGFSCVPHSAIGAAACRPVCACNDDLDLASATDLRDECVDGTSPACTQNPGQGLCPD